MSGLGESRKKRNEEEKGREGTEAKMKDFSVCPCLHHTCGHRSLFKLIYACSQVRFEELGFL